MPGRCKLGGAGLELASHDFVLEVAVVGVGVLGQRGAGRGQRGKFVAQGAQIAVGCFECPRGRVAAMLGDCQQVSGGGLYGGIPGCRQLGQGIDRAVGGLGQRVVGARRGLLAVCQRRQVGRVAGFQRVQQGSGGGDVEVGGCQALMQVGHALAGQCGLAGFGLGLLGFGHAALGLRNGRTERCQPLLAPGRLALKDAGHVRDGLQVAAEIGEERAGAGVGEQALGVAVGFQQGGFARVLFAPGVQLRAPVRQFRGHGRPRFQQLQLAAAVVVGLDDRLAFAHPPGVQGLGVLAGLAQRDVGGRFACLRFGDSQAEIGSHLAEAGIEIAVEFEGGRRLRGPAGLAAHLREIVLGAFQRCGLPGAFQVQIARALLHGLEFGHAGLRGLVGRVRGAGNFQFSCCGAGFCFGRGGTAGSVRRLIAPLQGGGVLALGRSQRPRGGRPARPGLWLRLPMRPLPAAPPCWFVPAPAGPQSGGRGVPVRRPGGLRGGRP